MTRLNPMPTAIQQRVLEYIQRAVRENGRPPTDREIADHFHWKSRFAARRHVTALVRKGFLKKTPGVARGLNVPSSVTRRDGLKGVPLLGDVPAGRPIDAMENLEGTLGIDPAMFPEANVFALRVKGESMVGAGIRDGDVALVRQTPEAKDGDLVVAVMDGEATLKRFYHRNSGVVLHAENPAFEDIVIRPDADFSLSGVVIGIIRKIT